jgi:hypothetical protein
VPAFEIKKNHLLICCRKKLKSVLVFDVGCIPVFSCCNLSGADRDKYFPDRKRKADDKSKGILENTSQPLSVILCWMTEAVGIFLGKQYGMH